MSAPVPPSVFQPAGTQPTQTQSALSNVAQNIPVANQKVAAQQQATQDLQLQQAVGAAAPVQATAQNAQTLGAQQATQTGANQVQDVQAASGQNQAVAQLGAQVQALQQSKNLNDQKMGEQQQVQDNADQLGQLDSQAKSEMYDSKMQFAQTQQGMEITQERQLADFAKLTATNDQSFQNYTQTTNELMQRKTQLLTAAYNTVATTMTTTNDQAVQARQLAASMADKNQENAAQLQVYQLKVSQAATLRAAQVSLAKSIEANQAKQAGVLAKNQALATIGGAALAIGAVALAAPTGGASIAAYGAAAGAGAAIGGGSTALLTNKL